MSERYFVTTDERGEREVDKAEFVAVERRAGFRNTMGQPDEPGTAGFSNGCSCGRVEFMLDSYGKDEFIEQG